MNRKIIQAKKGFYSVMLISMLSLGVFAANAESPSGNPGIEQQVLSAKTRSDQEALASQYEKEAQEDQDKARVHREMAKAYAKVGYLSEKQNLIGHCNIVAKKYEDAAKENLALAKEHRKLAEKMK